MSNIVEQKRAKYNTIFKVGLIAIAAFVVAPIIFTVVTGMVGLIAAAVIGLVAVNAAPWVSMKLANWKIKSIVAEAKANPIETLTNLIIDSKKAFEGAKEGTVNAVAARDTAFRKFDGLVKRYPARAAEFAQKKELLAKKVEKKKVALDNMSDRIVKAEETLEEMKAYWDVAQAFHAADAAAGDVGDVYEKLKADTSYDAIYESLASACAEMEVADAITIEQIENDPSPTFMGTTLDVQTKVKA